MYVYIYAYNLHIWDFSTALQGRDDCTHFRDGRWGTVERSVLSRLSVERKPGGPESLMGFFSSSAGSHCFPIIEECSSPLWEEPPPLYLPMETCANKTQIKSPGVSPRHVDQQAPPSWVFIILVGEVWLIVIVIIWWPWELSERQGGITRLKACFFLHPSFSLLTASRDMCWET